MSGRLVCIFTELFTMAELSQGLLASNFNLYKGSKPTIAAYPMSFLIVFLILMILISLSYWHPFLHRYYEVLNGEDEFNSSIKWFHGNDDSYNYASGMPLNFYKGRYTNSEPEFLPYNGRFQSLAIQRSPPRIDFIPKEEDIYVSEDLGQIVRSSWDRELKVNVLGPMCSRMSYDINYSRMINSLSSFGSVRFDPFEETYGISLNDILNCHDEVA